jgi:hypothetical protein
MMACKRIYDAKFPRGIFLGGGKTQFSKLSEIEAWEGDRKLIRAHRFTSGVGSHPDDRPLSAILTGLFGAHN